jgi:cytochrome c biogenesis protein CcmG, thiol:disulfide interchange protein DsbE
MRRVAIAAVVLALAGCSSDDEAASPQYLKGGRDAFEAFVAKRRGTPVVVNKWASWCGPCRAEFPFLRDQARKHKGEVVFVGVNSQDNDGDAREFLDEHPVPFRHFRDPNLEVAATFNGVQAFPTTAFYDSKGELAFVHQGGYASERELAEDIDQYAR